MELDLEKITAKMDELKDIQAKLEFELKQTKKQIEKYELQLQAVLTSNSVESMQYGNYSFGWKETMRNLFNQKLFQEDYPDLFDNYKMQKTIKSFEFKIAG